MYTGQGLFQLPMLCRVRKQPGGEGARLREWLQTGVLVSAGVELNLFVVASMGLCFGYLLETAVIMWRCFSCCK